MSEIIVLTEGADKEQIAERLAIYSNILVMSYKEVVADYDSAAESAANASGLLVFPFDLNQELFSRGEVRSRFYKFIRLISMKPFAVSIILLPVLGEKDKPTSANIKTVHEAITSISFFLHPMFGALPESLKKLQGKPRTISAAISPSTHLTPKSVIKVVENNFPHQECSYQLGIPLYHRREEIGFWQAVKDDVATTEAVFAARYEVQLTEGGLRIYYLLPASVYSKDWNQKKCSFADKLCLGIYNDGLAHAGLYPPATDVPLVTKVIIENDGITIHERGRHKYRLNVKYGHNVGRAARLLIKHRYSNKWDSGYFSIPEGQTIERLNYGTLKAAVSKLNTDPEISCGVKFFRSARENKHEKQKGWRFEPAPTFSIVDKT